MHVLVMLAKVTDRLRNLVGQGEVLAEMYVIVQLPDGSTYHIIEVRPTLQAIVLVAG